MSTRAPGPTQRARSSSTRGARWSSRARCRRPDERSTPSSAPASSRSSSCCCRRGRGDHVKTRSFLFDGDGWRNFLLDPSILLLLAVGQAVVIITRNVDLSVGSVLGPHRLPDRTALRRLSRPPDRRWCSLAGILLGALLGLVNGALVAFGKVPALVITLGTLYIYRGIVLTWAGSDRINADDMPDGFLELGTSRSCRIPVLTMVAVVVLGVVGYYMCTAPRRPGAVRDRLRSGRRRAVRPAGPPRVLGAFVLSGALAGLAGVLFAARYGTVSSNAGLGIELQAVAAAVDRRGGDLRRQRHRLGRRARRDAAGDHQPGPADHRHPGFWQRAVVGALILGAIVPGPGPVRSGQARRLAEARDGLHERLDLSRPRDDDARSYPAYAQPLWRRLLLTREMAVIALILAGRRRTRSPTCRTSTAR